MDLLNDAVSEQLTDAIRRAQEGESLFAPQVLRRLIDHYVEQTKAGASKPRLGLTDREQEVLILIPASCRTPRSRMSARSPSTTSRPTLERTGPNCARIGLGW